MRVAAVFKAAALAAAAALCAACTSINLAPDTLAGTSWRILTVNGQAPPAASNARLNFGPGWTIGGGFGCNGSGGKYRLEGDRLIVTDLHSTLIGCAEPLATLEQQGFAVLRQPMQVAFTGKERMSLSNEAGSIALHRAP